MVKKAIRLLAALGALLCWVPASAQVPSQEQAYQMQMDALQRSLHPVTGDVPIQKTNVTLHLGSAYYFLPAEDAQRVLVQGWGNRPSVAEGVLGMVFPAGKTFMDDTWGAVITYDAMGYVSDEDAAKEDYDKLLTDIQAAEPELNEQLAKDGRPTQHLVGWAQPPHYDATTHSVVWAQNIQFQGQGENSLNYDVRLLGRYGVLSLNMVTRMGKLAETEQAASRFAASAQFNQPARYADYKPGVDKKAEIGVAGLVATGLGVAAAKKLGLLAVILAFGKKLIVLIVAAGAAIAAWFRRSFGRGDDLDSGANSA
jgi:uncharacterized membrane-anchored protein